MTLRPTLWRTCRALANRPRLRIIALLLQQPDQTVSDVAEGVGLSSGTASQYLRSLNSRGLLRARRTGRWVSYRIAPDRSIPGTDAILRGLRSTFARARDPVEQVFKLATSFTHPRRIETVKQLSKAPLEFTQLSRRTHISPPALRRHLAKLEARGIITCQRLHHADLYRLAVIRSQLGKILLRLACES